MLVLFKELEVEIIDNGPDGQERKGASALLEDETFVDDTDAKVSKEETGRSADPVQNLPQKNGLCGFALSRRRSRDS